MKTPQQLLSQPTLHHLYQKSSMLQKIGHYLPQLLPTPLAQHCQVANLRQNVLVLHVDHAIWTMQIRFQEQDICQRWQQVLPNLPPIHQVEVKVVCPMTAKRETHAAMQPLPATAVALLQQVAEDMPHARLKAALLKLACHGQTAHKDSPE